MGTNYYARIIPTKERREEICKTIMESDDFDRIQTEISRTYGTIDYDSETSSYSGGQIHLGKSSYGWKFLWNTNFHEVYNGHMDNGKWVQDPSTICKVYDLDRKSISEFVNRKDIEIYDEYGDVVDKKDFLNDAFSDYYGDGKKKMSAKEYDEEEKKRDPSYKSYAYLSDYGKFLKQAGYDIEYPYSDFMHDGLRFATCDWFC